MIHKNGKAAAAGTSRRPNIPSYSFPTGAQIRRMTDPDEIVAEMDKASLAISRIRTDLEFPIKVTESGAPDPNWDRKARAAMSYGLTAIDAMNRHLIGIRRGGKASPDAIENRRQNLIAQYIKAEADRTKLVNRQLSDRAERNSETDFHTVFSRLARQLLPPATYEYLHDAAEEKVAENVRARVPAISEISVLPPLQPFQHFASMADGTIQAGRIGNANGADGGRDAG